MPNAATSAYLAKHYLDGAKADAMLARAGQSSSGSLTGMGANEEGVKKRKKKRRDKDVSHNGLRVVEDTDEGWRAGLGDGTDEEDGVVVVADQEEAARAKRKRWSRVGGSAGEEGAKGQPSKIAEQIADPPKAKIVAGLKTREEMRAQRLERERLAEERAKEDEEEGVHREAAESERKQREMDEAQQETVYRDASGRRIDVKAEEEEEQRQQQRRKRRELERQDWNKGDAQLRKAREDKQREMQMREEGVTRHATDARMNDELRNRERAVADPAAAFLTQSSKAKREPYLPTYKGSFPPNRFGIRPGYRWDGVERSNGFEAKLFQRRNERSIRQAENRAWRQEDM